MSSLKLGFISDTHNQHDKLDIPKDLDILFHAGDFTGNGTVHETKAFLEWFNKQSVKHKIFISGNHDWLDELNPSLFKEILKEYPTITYLRDEGTEVEGIKIWGRPTTPEFGGWAFMADRESAKMHSTLKIIPSDIDILLTHGSPYKILDEVNGKNVGCEDLLNELDRIQCKLVVFGHLHESSGIKIIKNKTFINAAVLNDRYKLIYKPKTMDYTNE